MAPKKEILQPGSMFGRYRIERRLGLGGMGAVYEATHLGLSKRVAIKALLPELANEPEVQVRFLREGESAARIKHPNVVDIYDVGTEGDITYLVMEYLEGKDLGRLLKEEGPLPIHKTVDLLLPVLAALMAAHENGVIHRDLKPANIFLAQGPHGMLMPKVLDFGIARIKSDSPSDELTSTGALLGTPFYMSPEQASGSKNLDARSDQYSVGVILYQALTGERPFAADSMYRILHRIVQGEFDPPRKLKPDLPESFEAVVMKAMATRPDQRYPTVKELGAAMIPYASDRVRARWEPIFGEVASSADLPSTYHQPQAALAEPITEARPETLSGTPAPGRSKGLMIAAAGLFLVSGGVLWFAAGTGEVVAPIVVEKLEAPPPPAAPRPPPVETYQVKISARPLNASIVLDGQPIGASAFARTFEKNGMEHALVVSADGHVTQTVKFMDAAPPISEIVLEKVPKKVAKRTARKPPPPRKTPAEKAPPPAQPKKGVNDALIIR